MPAKDSPAIRAMPGRSGGNVMKPSNHGSHPPSRAGLWLVAALGATFLTGCPSSSDRDLQAAAGKGRLDVAVEAMYQGAGADARDPKGLTPLMLAARNGHRDLVKFLLDQGASIDLRAPDGSTALTLAVARDRADVVETLLEAGARVDIRSRRYGLRDLTPLHVWVLAAGREAVGKSLVLSGADLQAPAQDSLTPVDLAVTAGRSEALGLLLAFARPDQRADLQRRALLMALEKNRLNVLKALLRTGAPADTRNQRGSPILIQAIRQGNPEAVAALLEAGASVLQGDPQGQSPLHWAVIGRKEELTLMLLSAGASPGARNGEGRTPLDLARRSGWTRGEEILAGHLHAEDAPSGS